MHPATVSNETTAALPLESVSVTCPHCGKAATGYVNPEGAKWAHTSRCGACKKAFDVTRLWFSLDLNVSPLDIPEAPLHMRQG